MGTYRAITNYGETTVVEVRGEEYALIGTDEIFTRADFMWVDPYPLDLKPAQYTDTKLVQLGDTCCAGGDEFVVEAIEPAHGSHLFGRVRGERTWYACEYVVLLERRK